MRNRKIRVLHDGNEYYLVDRGRTTTARVITFLLRLEKGKDEEVAPGSALVKTDVGDCVAVANWSRGELRIEEGHEEIRDALGGILERYLEEFRVGRSRGDDAPFFFLSIDKLPLFTLSPAHPNGLSVLVYSNEAAAQEEAKVRSGLDSRTIAVEKVGDLFDFLTARATDGFAGATIDGDAPIFFCLDAAGAPQFLRLALDPKKSRLEHHLLDLDGSWDAYEGEEELTPEIDQEVVDRHMTDRLGDIPFLGFFEGIRLLRPKQPTQAERLITVKLDDDDAPVSPLFHDDEGAEAFLVEHKLTDCELEPVDDLKELCRQALQERRILHIHPGTHRARGGALWLHDDTIVLDSYSGLWTSTDGVTFSKNELDDAS